MWAFRALCVFLTALILSFSALAQSDDPTECGGIQTVYFANGIGVLSEDDAAESFKLAIPRIKLKVGGVNGDTRFSLAYNRSARKLRDVGETARQILGNEYPSLLIGYLMRIGNLPGFLIPSSLRTQLNDALRSSWAQALIQGSGSNADVQNHVNSYSADLSRGRKVVVIAHSQGNIFANLAYTKLTNQQQASFSIVPVASPDSVIRKSLVGHVTFVNDLVIDLVQLLRSLSGLPLAPLPNDFAQMPGSDLGHYFAEDYLSDESAGEFISNGAATSLSALPKPATNSCEQVVTFLARGRVVYVDDAGGLLSSALPRLVGVGTSASFEMKFDLNATDLIPSNQNRGWYLARKLSMKVGSNTPSSGNDSSNLSINVERNNPNYGSMFTASNANRQCSNCIYFQTSFQLLHAAPGYFVNDSLPANPPLLSAFGTGFVDRIMVLTVYDNTPGRFTSVYVSVDSFVKR